VLIALSLLLWAAPARAQDPADPTWYAGRKVASVELVAGEGTLVDQDLRPLLRAVEDRPLDPATIQLDLRTLYRVAPVAAIEADVIPWPVYDERVGEAALGVKVRYILYPAPRVHAVRVQGVRRASPRRVSAAARLSEGDPFQPEFDTEIVADRVLRALRGAGFPEARVEIQTFQVQPDDPFSLEVWIRVDEGAPRLLDTIEIEGVPAGLSEHRVHRWARSAGLKPGKPIAEDAITRARYAIRRKLARVTAGPGADLMGPTASRALTRVGVLPPGGWVEARVLVDEEPLGDGRLAVRVDIDPGKRLELRTSGIRATDARRALGVDERLRLTRGFLEDAPARVEQHLAMRGYNAAQARVELRESASTQELAVVVAAGVRHRRKPFLFEGNETLSDVQLRTVLNQSSPDVLRRRRQTDAALARGAQAMRDLYRSVGHDEVRITIEPTRYRRRLPLLTLDRSKLWITQSFRIHEGPLNRIRRVEVEGAAPSARLAQLDDALAALEGGPYSPQGLQALAQRIVEVHRAAGYLDAQARVRSRSDSAQSFDIKIVVDPGDRILLRSFATRGNRRVSTGYLRRTLSPPVGQPLDGLTLEEIRQRLYDLGMFSSVELTLIGDDAARDLVVELRERPRHTVETGFGLASDQGVRALGRWTMRNLFGPADRIDTNALVGLRFGPSTGALAPLPVFRTPEYRLGSNYSLPISRLTDVTVSLIGQEEVQERNWRLIRRAVAIQGVYHPRRSTLLQLRARFEHRRLAGVDPGALLKTDVWADPALRLPSAPSVDTRGRLVDQLEFVWLDDHRDNPLQPTRGYLASTRVAFSPQLLQPAYARHLRVPLLAAEARGALVIPLGPLSLRVNGEGGHQRVVPIGTIAAFTVDGDATPLAVPVEERYRLGGTASLRGFRRDGVGPLQRVRQLDLAWPDALGPTIGDALRLDDSRYVPTGGDTFARATADLLIPLPALGLPDWQGYDLALFLDVGQSWFLQSSAATPGRGAAPRIRAATGVGLRVLTPVGPLQMDLAVNPSPVRQYREPVARLHLSLGTLF
jgi:outer membrane protein assembly factor BamA